MEYISRSPEETQKIAEEFASRVEREEKPVIILLKGEIGAGKTTFARGFLKKFGVKKVRSPTFNIIHQHKGGNLTLYHIDLYRLSPEEVERLEIWDIVSDGENIVLVEWYEHAPRELFDRYYLIQMEIIDENSRKITIEFINQGSESQ